MVRVTPEQVLARFKQDGSFDTLRHALLSSFQDSKGGAKFDALVNSALHSLAAEHAKDLLSGIRSAINGAMEAGAGAVSRPLEVEGPRGMMAGGRLGGHSFYRRGDSVAAFVPTTDPLLTAPQYACIQAEIVACDAPKNMYTVRDTSALPHAQDTWAVYWDQMLMIKKAMEQSYRIGDQVYALFRDDLHPDTAVSTEFFPGRIVHVGMTSLAVEFRDHIIGHAYYDEVFAAGRVGFLRRQSDKRRRADAPDAMVEVHGRVIPSFIGFWPSEEAPALGKRNRSVKYRPRRRLLIQPHRPLVPPAAPSPPHMQITQSRASSEIEMDTSSSPQSPAIPTASAVPHVPVSAPVSLPPPPPPPVSAPPPPPPPQIPAADIAQVSSEEEGEIEPEDGELASSRESHAPSPRLSYPGTHRSPSRTGRQDSWRHESVRRQEPFRSRSPAYSRRRSPIHYDTGSRHQAYEPYRSPRDYYRGRSPAHAYRGRRGSRSRSPPRYTDRSRYRSRSPWINGPRQPSQHRGYR
ncbi:hypothetical protein DL89DRAFT_265148 [Linderina pennispora]|uniref:SGF29 C-terminal domain-containing protein n=1 Tax=Linderina pennispora TaxID=61395 RepID=A0A1Y1WHF0_9FUNG|nr:uncharacterized protein DL89DRAFT_265148 [Linderina pennispora]ORX72990.1 hypothetical protein DL89DRAFT_265148 [Linderina pennispora]